ncbi:MAG: hypothetical protein LBV74_22790 [Tannerella sp.]|jgi:hypothetical protein|nr:hypothetical protein [Tannerella sp.]
MILKLFEYFARFPERAGVISAFANGKSDLPFYNELLGRVKMLPDNSLMPDIKHYVFGADMDTVKRRVDSVTGTYLFIDFGEIDSERNDKNSIQDSLRMAATIASKVSDVTDIVERAIISDITLTLINELRARIYTDSSRDKTPWLQELSFKHSITPFVVPELSSVGWSVVFTSEGSDILNLKSMIKSFTK